MKLEDVAKKAGVSTATVSRVINFDPNVKDSTRSRAERTLKSEDITYSRLNFDMVRPTVSEFRVLETGTNSVDIRVAEGSTYTSRTVISRGAATSGRGGRWFRRHTRKLASVGDSAGGTRSERLWLKTWVAGACA